MTAIPFFSQEPTAAPHLSRIGEHTLKHPNHSPTRYLKQQWNPHQWTHLRQRIPKRQWNPHHWSHLRQGTQHPHRPYRSSPTTQAPRLPQPQVFPPLRYPHLHQHWTSSHAQVAIGTHQNIMNQKRESG